MSKTILLIFFWVILFLGFSCQYQVKRVEPILQKAESILEQNPDSTLLLLHEIIDAEKLKKELYYEYFLLKIQAKYKNYEDITADTLIFTIRDYYKNKNQSEKTALATFYCGRLYQEQKKNEEALQEFLNTEQLLERSKNFNLKGLCQDAIGNLYYKQHLNNKAIVRFKKRL